MVVSLCQALVPKSQQRLVFYLFDGHCFFSVILSKNAVYLVRLPPTPEVNMTGLPNDISALPPIDHTAATANNHVGQIASAVPLGNPPSYPRITSDPTELDVDSGIGTKSRAPEVP